MIGPGDERPHMVGEDPAWSESYYFAWFDERGSGITRIGVRPNEGTMDVLLVLFPPEGGIAVTRRQQPQHDNTDRLEVAGASYELLEPLRRWRVRFEGELLHLPQPRLLLGEPGDRAPRPFSLDYELTAFTPAAEATLAGSRAAFARTAAGHYEQAGRISGTIDGAPFSGTGYRDKSWGVRDWSAPTLWRWFALPFGPDLVANVVILRMGDHEVRGGWAQVDGEVRAVSGVALDTRWGPDGRAHEALHLGFDVEGAERIEVDGEVLEVAPLPLAGPRGLTLVNEGLTRYTRPDGRSTLGIAEYLHQVADPPAEMTRAAALFAG